MPRTFPTQDDPKSPQRPPEAARPRDLRRLHGDPLRDRPEATRYVRWLAGRLELTKDPSKMLSFLAREEEEKWQSLGLV